MSTPELIVTEQDYRRLQSLLDVFQSKAADDVIELLDAELRRAKIVPSEGVPADVITMNSRVRFEDEVTGQSRTITLVYPHDADIRQDKISILAPVGSALLGLSVGQSIEWPLPGGRKKRYRILEVMYQPEAAGDFHL